MSIITLEEEIGKRNGSHRKQGGRKYQRVFIAVTDDQDDGPKTVIDALLAQKSITIGTVYTAGNDSDPGAFCNLIDPTLRSDTKDVFDILVDYSNVEGDDEDDREDDPLDEPADIDYGTIITDKVFEEEFHLFLPSTPVVNSAGDPFDPPQIIEDYIEVITIRRNEATFDSEEFNFFKGSVNEFSVASNNPEIPRDPGTVRIADITATKRFKGDQTFFAVTYVLHVKLNKWQPLRILDQGLRKIVADTRVNIKDANGDTITSPVPLDGSGGELPVGGTVVYLEFDPFDEVDFFNLDLPAF